MGDFKSKPTILKKDGKHNTNYLTSIRGFACLIVIAAHLMAVIPQIGINVSGCGKIGVWLFFVLSALLLTIQWIDKETIKKEDVFKFYIKRTFRIFPCYIAVLLVALLIGYIPNIASFINHIFLMEGIGHFWTIPVEFIFYLIVPILAIVINKIGNNKISVIFLATILVVTAIIWPYTEYIENSINLKWYIPVFLMGMITAFFYTKLIDTKKTSIVCDIMFFVILALMLISTPYFRNLIFKIEPTRYLMNKYLYFGLAWCIVILSIQNSKYVIKFLNNSKFLIFCGNISFPLYLVHFVLLDKIKVESLILNSILVVVISFILAILINKFIEKPMIKVSKVINKKLFEREEK